MEELAVVEMNEHRGVVTFDDEPINPITDCDGFFGTIYYAHSRYDLEGCEKVEDHDDTLYKLSQEDGVTITCEHCGVGLEYNGYGTWHSLEEADEEYIDVCKKADVVEFQGMTFQHHKPKVNGAYLLPICGYDHGALHIYVGTTFDRWDGGRLGVIAATPQQVKDIFGEGKTEEEITEALESSVKSYDNYLNGLWYRYIIEDAEGGHVEQCGGYDDEDECKKGMIGVMEDLK